MTTFSTPRTWNVGELVTKAMLDQQIRDNMNAIWVGTTAGDMEYYTAANAKTRLAVVAGGILYGGASAPAYLATPASTSVLQKASGSGAPVWLAQNSIPGILHKTTQKNFNTGGQVITATSYSAITNATVNIVTTVTCDILMIVHGDMAVSSPGGGAFIQPVIGGTAGGDAVAAFTSNAYFTPFCISYRVDSVAAGTITCKIQGRANTSGSGDHLLLDNGHIEVLAFAS